MERKVRKGKQGINTIDEGFWSIESMFRTLLESLPQKAGMKDINSVYILCNESFARDLKIKPDEIKGKTDYDFYPKDLAEKHRAEDKRIMGSGKREEIEERQIQDGKEIILSKSKSPVKDMDGNTVGILLSFWDITEMRRREEIINRQAQEILEISTPVIQVLEGLVVAPLIGMLDSERTYRFMERFLNAIVETNSPVAMVDITGVPAIDTQTAQHLIETITAARLLGTKVILTGVRPAIAQTLVHLGIDLSGVETCASLKAGLQLALEMVGLQIVKKNDRCKE